jgi:hypothetical protein
MGRPQSVVGEDSERLWLSSFPQELLPGKLLQARRVAMRLSHEAVNHVA